jgi:hypothetical protein
MSTVEECEQTIAALHDKRNAASKRTNELAGERQRLGFAVYADGDQTARAKLDKLNADLAGLAVEAENIKAAIVEADRRLAAAQHAVTRTAATERRARASALLKELEGLGPALDRTAPHPDGGFYLLNDPPLRVKVAALVGGLCVELRALGLTDVSFPAHYKWDVAAWQDLRRTLLDTMHAGWPAPAQRVTAKERDSFAGLLAAFARIIRSNLEQTTKETADAAA